MGRSATGKPRRRRHKVPGLPRFFTKQLLAFLLLAFVVIVVDFILYAFITYRESMQSLNDGTPAVIVRAVDAGLSLQDGTYVLSAEASTTLAEQSAWAQLVDSSGMVVWSQNLPPDVPLSYTTNDAAMAAHYAAIADYPAFFWDRGQELLIVGFPRETYWHMAVTFPAQTAAYLPLYALILFTVDITIFFAVYLVSRRRTQRAVAPILDALDDLSEGRPAILRLRGDLSEIGKQITETSMLIEQKDAARVNWIRGVSHDIRTPLSMILGFADGIAQDEDASSRTRANASVIRSQGLKIRDLVTDLNTASRLDYDMQPLDLGRVHLARLLRGIVAEHVNSGLDQDHPLELSVSDAVADAVVLGDERLLTRAVENVIANARVHNESGCSTAIELDGGRGETGARTAVIRIADDGKGVAPTTLADLEARLARARTAQTAAGCAVGSSEGGHGAEHGLGLVLVDRITRAHHGHLSLSSVPEQGFAVRIELPLA